MRIKVDMHVHTTYSGDSSITLENIAQQVASMGLDGVAITDHDSVEANGKLKEKSGLIVIPGVEVTSREGHILGLGVSNPVRRGLSAQETVDEIHKLGGLAVAAHPLNIYKKSLNLAALNQLKIDAVETFNASTFILFKSNKPEKLADKMRLPRTGGSDAHTPSNIGKGYTIIETEGKSIENILNAIREGKTTAAGQYITMKEIFLRLWLKAGNLTGKNNQNR